jgi:arylsulfatase A-like enzyme
VPARSRLRLGALALGVLAGALAGGCSRDGGPRPARNVLLVVLDTTRADHLGTYGHAGATTPTIDALAAGGARFDAAYAQSSLTPVSAASFLTGTWPYRTGVRSLFTVAGATLSPEVPSLVEALRASGRRTAAFVSARPMGRHYGLDRGFESYDDDLADTVQRYRIEWFPDSPQRPAEETTDRALAWLRAHGREPFALMLHWFDAHDPSFVPPGEFLAAHLSFAPPPELGRRTSPETWPALQRRAPRIELYDAEIAYMDRELGRVLAALGELGVREETLVCVIGDHGEAFGEHGFWTHGLLYEEQLRVPLVFAGPGVPRGVAIADPVRLVDLAPTLVDLLALSPVAGFDGSSLIAHLAGGAPAGAAEREIYAEVHHAPEDRLGRDPASYSLRFGRWKLIHRPAKGADELYDLEEDPRELRNLYAPDHGIGRQLRERLLAVVDGEVPSLEQVSPEEREHLRALGYL